MEILDLQRCPFCGHKPDILTAKNKTKESEAHIYIECNNFKCATQCSTQLMPQSLAVKTWNCRNVVLKVQSQTIQQKTSKL
jgi:hypothetical protein